MELPINTPQPVTFKEKFEVKLALYEQQNQGSQRKPWTTERILEVINNVRKARVSIISKQARTSMDYYWMSKYDTMDIANEVFLIFKKKSPDDPTVRILPRNEYFGTLEDIHKACGHGGRDKMLHAIKSRYYIPRKAIEIFLALCPTCETKKALPKKGIITKPIVSQDFNIRGQVDLIDFQSCPDGGYKWLLNYQDNATKFVSLRPLKTKRAQEVAMELMKIFMIFGAPYILQSDIGREFTAKIIEELTSLWPECKIVHGSSELPQTQGSVERSNQDVENMLRTWMNDNNSTNWSVGCHHVQYKKNASFHRIIGRSPYKAIFGCNPKAGLKDSDVPTSILSNVETEEQLQNLSQKEFSSKFNLVDSVIKPENSEIPDQIDCHPDIIKLEPCGSKKFLDESAADKNNSQVQEQPDDNKDHIKTVKLENQEPNFTCVVCHNDCTGAHIKCTSCENAMHAICGLSDEDYGSTVLCYLCKCEQNIKSERNEALKGTKRAAEKIANNTEKKLRSVRDEPETSSEDSNDDISDTSICLREAVSWESVFRGQEFQKCICKPAQKQCRTNRCACFKKKMLCGSKCHNSLSCVNK